MKKVLLTMTTTLLCMIALFGCEKHTHDYVKETVVEADCNKSGLIIYTCACGDTYNESINATEIHLWNDGVVSVEATCTTDGITTCACTICGKTKEEIIPAVGEHKWGESIITKEASCAEEGQLSKTCESCGIEETSEIAKLETHTWNDPETTKEATCAEEGVSTHTCTICNETKTDTIPVLKEHTWDNGTITKEPTCAEKGELTYTCTICKVAKTEGIAATDVHTWDSGSVTKTATCSVNGEQKYTCTVCQKTKTETIVATGIHKWDNGVVTKNATCGEDGTKIYTCSLCNKTKTDSIQKTGNHAWDDGKETVVATAITNGETTYTCQTCGEIKTQSIPKKGKIINSKSYTNKNVYVDYSTNNGGDFSYCISTETPNVLGIEQEFQLKPNTIYIITVDVKTKNVVSHENQFFSLGANISAEYLYNNSQGVLGDSDWTTISLIAKSDEKGILGVSLNLGYWYNACSGTIWYDNLKITEYSDFMVEDPTWNFLFVVLTNTSLNTYDDDLKKQLNISHQMTDAEYKAICKSVEDFENDLTNKSKGVLKANATIVKCNAEISDYEKSGNGYYITAGAALKYLNEQNINIDEYDHVVFVTSFPDLPRSYFGLGGTFIKGYRGFSLIMYGDGGTDCTRYCYDVSESNWPAGLYVHEFIHSIENYAKKFGFTVPSADGSGQYGYGTQNTDGWRKFYMDIILNQVKYNGTYTGVDPSIWRIPPRLFG